MKEVTQNILSYLTYLLLVILVIQIILIQYHIMKKTKNSPIKSLVIIGFNGLGVWVIMVSTSLIFSDKSNILLLIFFFISSVSLVMSTLSFSIGISLILNADVGIRRIVLFSVLLTSIVFINSYIIFFQITQQFLSYIPIIINIVKFLILMGILIMTITTYFDYKQSQSRVIVGRSTFDFEFYTFLKSMLILFWLFPIIIIDILTEYTLFIVYALYLVVILSLLLNMLIKVPAIKLFRPSNNFLILINNKDGILLYHRDFFNYTISIDRQALFANWLNAFSSIITQYLDKDIKPQVIEFEKNYIINFKWSEEIVISVISDSTSALIQPAMYNLLDRLLIECPIEYLSKGMITSETKETINQIVTECFFFL